ncbi:MAG: type II toxin-antitoxin system RelE/ParE family toxin [Patescibacteria group bacterium]
MEVKFFHRDVKAFLDNLDRVTNAKAVQLLEFLAEEGKCLPMPFGKKLGKDLYELRVQSLQNVRIFYTFYGGQIFLLHAIFKKEQKLKPKDLNKAKHRLTELHNL